MLARQLKAFIEILFVNRNKLCSRAFRKWVLMAVWKLVNRHIFWWLQILGTGFFQHIRNGNTYTTVNNFCLVISLLIKCQSLLGLSRLINKALRNLQLLRTHHGKHFPISVLWLTGLEQSVPLLLKIQVTRTFWKKIIWDDLYEKNYLHIHILMKTVLVVCYSDLIERCHIWPYHFGENVKYSPKFSSFKTWLALWPWK